MVVCAMLSGRFFRGHGRDPTRHGRQPSRPGVARGGVHGIYKPFPQLRSEQEARCRGWRSHSHPQRHAGEERRLSFYHCMLIMCPVKMLPALRASVSRFMRRFRWLWWWCIYLHNSVVLDVNPASSCALLESVVTTYQHTNH